MSAAVTLAVPSVVFGQSQRSEETQMTPAVEHIDPEGMHKSPVFSQGIVIPAGARTLIIGGQNGVGADSRVVSNDLAGQSAKAVDMLR
jgi:hypothetical protein